MVWLEGFNYSYICGLFPRLVASKRGEMPLAEIETLLVGKRARKTRPPTSVIAVENPHNDHGGLVVSEDYLRKLSELAHKHGSRIHMDGARIHNASVASGVSIRDYARHVDTIAVSLNKGLGAPFGALFCGTKADIESAHVNLLRIGAWNIHRAGIFAAAGYYAATEMVERLADDHARAKRLADGIRDLPGLDVTTPETNMVRISTKPGDFGAEPFVERLRELGVLANQRTEDMFKMTVCHAITDDDIDAAIAAVSKVIETFQGHKLQAVG
jgi:threonine aldolase